MINQEEVKYIEAEIKKTISLIENSFYHELMRYDRDEETEEFPGYTKTWICYRIKDLYYLIRVYLEVKEVFNYLADFCQKYDSVIDDESSLLKSELYHPESESELKIVVEFKQVLSPFRAFDYRATKQEEVIKIQNILKHTDHILRNINAPIKNESDIYKQIRWILGLYYPQSRFRNKASFIQEFKTYNPDILIPDQKTAIEYKYIKDKDANIDDYIDQIRTDANNYTGDYRYENFIAVLYIADTSIATQDAIRVAWDQKKFPSNWELVVAMGSR